jgi:hypothetical protein
MTSRGLIHAFEPQCHLKNFPTEPALVAPTSNLSNSGGSLFKASRGMKKPITHKKGWWCGSSSKLPALQVQSPEFKPQYCTPPQKKECPYRIISLA